jgi:hypothetical protein
MAIDWSGIVKDTLVPAVATAGVLVVNYILPKLPGATAHLFDWMKSRTAGIKNSTMRNVLDHVITLAGQKVLALEQTEVAFIQQQLKDGKISKDQLPALMAGVKQKAIDSVKVDLTAQGLMKDVEGIFGGSPSSMTKWLGDVVESHVSQLPSTGLGTPAVAPSIPPSEMPTPVPPNR